MRGASIFSSKGGGCGAEPCKLPFCIRLADEIEDRAIFFGFGGCDLAGPRLGGGGEIPSGRSRGRRHGLFSLSSFEVLSGFAELREGDYSLHQSVQRPLHLGQAAEGVHLLDHAICISLRPPRPPASRRHHPACTDKKPHHRDHRNGPAEASEQENIPPSCCGVSPGFRGDSRGNGDCVHAPPRPWRAQSLHPFLGKRTMAVFCPISGM